MPTLPVNLVDLILELLESQTSKTGHLMLETLFHV